MNRIQVHFRVPGKPETLTLSLPRETPFSALAAELYEADFIKPQKPGGGDNAGGSPGGEAAPEQSGGEEAPSGV
ncbi:MAG: hypothetical protein HFF86_05740, partial [Oscillibacter sp.]|nr:hypothetical protein [Oscillibacter sp.]